MSSKTLLIVLALIVIIGGGYFLFGKNASNNESAQINVGGEAANESAQQLTGKKMAFSEFIKQGGSYKCSVNQYIDNTETKGTVYIDGDMMRGEYNVMTHGMNMTSTMVMRDGYTYSWSSMMPTMGYKMKMSAQGSTDTQASASSSYSWNAEQIGDYNCEAWKADASLFVIPTTITFTEM